MIAFIGAFILLGSLTLILAIARRAQSIMQDSEKREQAFMAEHTHHRDES